MSDHLQRQSVGRSLSDAGCEEIPRRPAPIVPVHDGDLVGDVPVDVVEDDEMRVVGDGAVCLVIEPST